MIIFKRILLPISLAILSACSGGSSDSTPGTGSSGSGTSITEAAFINSLSTGVVRVDTNVDLSGLSIAITPTITTTFSGNVTGSQVLSLIINGSNITSDSCTLEAPVTEPLTNDALNDGDIDLENCTAAYFEVSDTQSRIEYSCTGQIPSFSADFTYISSTAQFDLGDLSMDFTPNTALQNITTSDGVCGSLTATNTATATLPAGTVPDSSEKTFEIEVVAPYVNNNKIKLDLAFAKATLVADDYNIVSILPDATLNAVTLRLSSVEFGGTVTNPTVISAAGGTVTILSVGTRAYSGRYSVTLDSGENLEGTFSLSL